MATDVLRKVDEHSKKPWPQALDSEACPGKLVWKTRGEGARRHPQALMRAANADPNCAGVITWMHTFSPSKMWIAGLERAATARSATSIPNSTATFPWDSGSTWIS